ncbi:Thioredoxin domain-containing protein plp1 [Grifola frondosa]|uniref:Thioredoxin domain-containing protein plp1 n=1 Tax=Grifola frondosa TaxID=5627 RepID=A0A1C7M1N3_GRIFR|nr:Thioredoxin domain-containing protein plp1 [Grifola frondosa]
MPIIQVRGDRSASISRTLAMSSSNAKIAEFTARLTDPNRPSSSTRADDSDLDDEELFAQLEAEIEDDANVELREQGIARLKREQTLRMERLQQMKSDGHGRYEEITDEKEVIRISAREPRCVIHFYHSDFKRCLIMDKHLAKLASKYFGTRFLRVFVENVPWLVERLGIKVLPCVVCFIDGVSKDRVIGFEELGNEDHFETATLEWKLMNSGVIQKEERSAPEIVYGSTPAVRQHIRGQRDDDSDFDIDD